MERSRCCVVPLRKCYIVYCRTDKEIIKENIVDSVCSITIV